MSGEIKEVTIREMVSDMVEEFWLGMSEEDREQFEKGLDDAGLQEQVEKTRAKLNEIRTRLAGSMYGSEPPAIAGTAPNLMEWTRSGIVPVSAEDAANIPIHKGAVATIFLDGLIKRPADDVQEDMLHCAWCDASILAPHGFSLPDGWDEIEVGQSVKTETGADFLYMCDPCKKQELPE